MLRIVISLKIIWYKTYITLLYGEILCAQGLVFETKLDVSLQ